MSIELTDSAIASFDAMVKHDFQAEGHQLRNTVRLRTGIVGATHHYPKMGKGVATKRLAPQTNVTPMNVAHSGVDVTLENWVAPEYTDLFSQAEVNFDEKSELSYTIASAMGRREDQMIIDALAAATFVDQVNEVGNDIGGTNTNLNVAKLRNAMKLMDVANIPASAERYFIGHANQKSILLSETPVISADYANVKALVEGKIDTFLGFKFKWFGNMDEGGIPLVSTDRYNFAYVKSAIGLAEGIGMRTAIDWIPEKVSWLANACWRAGAKVIDNAGVIRVICVDAGLAA